MESGVIEVSLGAKDSFRITRWKVKPGTKISKGCLLGLYETQADKQILKLKAEKNHVGTVMEVLVQEKEVVEGKGSDWGSISKGNRTALKDHC